MGTTGTLHPGTLPRAPCATTKLSHLLGGLSLGFVTLKAESRDEPGPKTSVSAPAPRSMLGKMGLRFAALAELVLFLYSKKKPSAARAGTEAAEGTLGSWGHLLWRAGGNQGVCLAGFRTSPAHEPPEMEKTTFLNYHDVALARCSWRSYGKAGSGGTAEQTQIPLSAQQWK